MPTLSPRQRRFIQEVAHGSSTTEAAKRAGYSKANYRHAAMKLQRNPKVKDELEKIQAQVREQIMFGMVEANHLIDESIVFARKNKNPMALAKSTEIKLKLNGLMIERIQEVPVDLRGALEQARMRIINAGRLDASTLDVQAAPQAEAITSVETPSKQSKPA